MELKDIREYIEFHSREQLIAMLEARMKMEEK